MRTLTRTRLGLAIALMAALAGCSGPCDKLDSITAPTLNANGVDLTTYVAVGTSLSSGYESGGIVDRHQVHSFPSLFARQIGKTVDIRGDRGTFTQPTVNNDGIDTLLEIKSYSPLIINKHGRVGGSPTNLGQTFPYHNMGIPGAIISDLVDSSRYNSNGYFALIQRTRGLVLVQALSLQPTIMSLEYGANEILGFAAVQGTDPPPQVVGLYAQVMTLALNTIHTALPGTRVAVFNVPDVTTIPFFTTLPARPPDLTTGQPVPLIGASGSAQAGDLLLLGAGPVIAQTGTGVPTGVFTVLNPSVPGNGQPLPESAFLRAGEVSNTQAVVAGLNAIVDSVSTRPFVSKVDLAGLLVQAKIGIPIGGAVYTNKFITGGLFSLDGVHPNDLGYALMANTMIESINAKFGCFVPPVDPLAYASANASAAEHVSTGYPLVQGLDETFRKLFGR
jgi:hypothetical protein